MRPVVALIAASLALSVAAAATATTHPRPGLRITVGAPLTVRGTNFGGRALVTVRVVAAGTRASKRLRAGLAGGFVVRFDGVSVYPCAITSIVAVAANGRSASVKMPPAQCPQPPAP